MIHKESSHNWLQIR